ncbi:MAG TPA: flagellar biosynthesis protein FliQ [Spirochaetes bacterium]|nr:flagellar biosynthesis protein FliQ [Spirochaetota bacterium]
MTDAMIIKLMTDALIQVLIIGAPILGISMIVGLIISIFQTTTSIQEQTLTFVPKIIAIFGTIILFASWIMNSMKSFTEALFHQLPNVVR